LAECVERAKTAGDLPKVFQAYETIRKPRVDFLIQRGRFNASVSHLPDGEKQKERDQRLRNLGGGLPEVKSWNGKNVDDPPSEPFGPKTNAYINGFDILDYVSCTPLISNMRF
jgi:salicylate hydroxylase